MNIYLGSENKSQQITKFKKDDKYDKHNKIQKSNIMLLLSHYLIHLCNIPPPPYFMAASSYDNDFVVFSVERIER